jgi:hypothetical protein
MVIYYTMTIEQYTQSLRAKFDELESNFFPLQIAAETYKADASVRIWDQSKNSADQDMLSVSQYSNKPAYIRDLPRKAGSDTGKTGKPITTSYFSGGYGQMKQEVGRPPVELFGTLRSDFVSTPFVSESLRIKIGVSKDESAGKIAGLQKKWGLIFYPTPEEINTIANVIAFETAQFLNA